MVSLKQATANSVEAAAVSPRISFSADFLDEDEGFISLIPNSGIELTHKLEFEFSSIKQSNEVITAADELFSDGKLLPTWQIKEEKTTETGNKAEEKLVISTKKAVSFGFLEDDPSPRPPRCTVLWKELLKLRKQCASSSSSSMAPSTGESSKERKGRKEKEAKRVRKGFETSTRARSLMNVPTSGMGEKPAAATRRCALSEARSVILVGKRPQGEKPV